MNNTCNLCPADMTMIRGDLFEYPLRFSLNEDTAYRLLDGDVLRFGVFRGRKPMLLLRYYSTQQAADGTIKITIAPELTERMAPGDYRFEAELASDINGIHTVAGGTFRLMEDRITPDVRNGVVKPPDYPDSELPDDHERLNGREKSDQHPIKAITGLSRRLADLAIANVAEGERKLLYDASGEKLYGLAVFGRTAQNSAPVPEAPVPLVSCASGGTLTTTVCGKNLLNNTASSQTVNGVTFTVNGDGSVTASGTAVKVQAELRLPITIPKGRYVISGCPSGGGPSNYFIYIKIDGAYHFDTGDSFEVTLEEEKSFNCVLTVMPGIDGNGIQFRPMIRLAEIEDGTYEDYDGSSASASVTGGLCGIPVPSGGNYTDENGQQWLCDVVDFARGVLIRRVAEISGFTLINTFTNCNRYRALAGNRLLSGQANSSALCSHTDNYLYSTADRTHFYCETDRIVVYLPIGTDATDLTVVCALESPVETALTAEEIAAFKALRTKESICTIINNAGAYMAAAYVPDSMAAICVSKRLSALEDAILSLGGNV